MKTCLFINDQSSTAARYRAQVESLARGTKSRLIAVNPQHSLRDQVRAAARAGCRRLIVAGGDGTVSQLVNVLGPKLDGLELGILPTGTGNDLARALGVPLDSLDDAWRMATECPAVPIDVGRVTTHDAAPTYFVNSVTGGFGGKVAADIAPADKQLWGAFAYWITALSELLTLQEHQLNLTLDDRTVRCSVYGLGLANGGFVGGGFPLAPAARLDDGLLDVVTIPVLPTWELMSAGLAFTLGEAEQETGVCVYRSSVVRVQADPDLPFSLDGEPFRSLDATFDVLPRVLRVACDPHITTVRLATIPSTVSP